MLSLDKNLIVWLLWRLLLLLFGFQCGFVSVPKKKQWNRARQIAIENVINGKYYNKNSFKYWNVLTKQQKTIKFYFEQFRAKKWKRIETLTNPNAIINKSFFLCWLLVYQSMYIFMLFLLLFKLIDDWTELLSILHLRVHFFLFFSFCFVPTFFPTSNRIHFFGVLCDASILARNIFVWNNRWENSRFERSL